VTRLEQLARDGMAVLCVWIIILRVACLLLSTQAFRLPGIFSATVFCIGMCDIVVPVGMLRPEPRLMTNGV